MVLQQRLIFVPSRQWYVLRAMPTSASRLSALTCGSPPAFLTGIVFSRLVRLSGSAPGSFPTSSADPFMIASLISIARHSARNRSRSASYAAISPRRTSGSVCGAPALRSGSSFATAVPFRSPSSCRLRFLTTEESTPRPAAACRDVISPDATLSTASRLGPSGTGPRLTRCSPGASSSIHAAGSALLGYPNRRIVRFARRPCVR